jgi:hypothetical protein
VAAFCYAQIGGLGVATFITLLLVPFLYSILVLDLKIIRWGLLGPLESMAGVLMCGVSVCLLFATITRLMDRDPRHSRKLDDANHPVAPEGESLC